MNIALPVLLLVFGGLSFWILTESNVKWYIKTACISVFCLFTVVFWSSIHSFLGWAANEKYIPEKILIHWVIVKEPNKLTKSEGSISILLQSAEPPKGNFVSKIFGYKREGIEPRLFKLKYNRKLHEQLDNIKKGLGKGQPFMGKLEKANKEGKAKGNEGEQNSNKQGEGSESQDQEWELHELRPSEIHSKPQN
tara:strand:+ start:1587 stop:2168 length:582 start_codon:yes stop_codon:yes gene_type:complete